MSHKIQDVAHRRIPAACAFTYRGHTISLSTIFPSKDVAVFFSDGTERHDLSSAEAAIDLINARFGEST